MVSVAPVTSMRTISPARAPSRRGGEGQPRIAGRPAAAGTFDQHRGRASDLRGEMAFEARCAQRAQPRRSRLAHGGRHLRHARGRGPPARGIGKDVEEGDAAFLDMGQRRREVRLLLGRKPGDEIGTEHDVGAQRAKPPA